jgi:uncharacterized protein (TIGR03067 family)
LLADDLPLELQGKWNLAEIHQQDQVTKITGKTAGCRIAGGVMTLQAGPVEQNYRIAVDKGKSPAHIDAALKTDEGFEVSQGVYHVVGNRLQMCFAVPGSPRPEAFSAHVGEPHFMWVFERPVEKPPFIEKTELTPEQQQKLLEASADLQGSWELVSMQWDGRNYPGEVQGRIVIRGDKATSYGGKQPVTYSLEIDPNKTPAQLNMLLKADGQLKIKQCIYKLEGDTLTLCHHFKSDKPRPTEFKTEASDGLLLSVLKRQSPIQQTGREE